MLDSKALASIPLIPANTAPPAPHYPWPKPYTSAMFLSFDVDAESAWTSKDALHAQRLITMSYGGYEARVGTPKLLELLDQLELKATFFVTGWSVDAHPAMAEAILKAGHEIGHHGYHHLLPDPGDPWIEEELERGFEALKRRLGVKPTGYRAPYGEFTEELRVALVRHGIVYTSSFRDDVRPYRHRLADGKPGHDRASGHRKLRRLDARTVRPVQPAADLSRRSMCSRSGRMSSTRSGIGARWSRPCCIRNAAAVRCGFGCCGNFSPMPNPAPICGSRPERRSRRISERHEAARPLRAAPIRYPRSS